MQPYPGRRGPGAGHELGDAAARLNTVATPARAGGGSPKQPGGAGAVTPSRLSCIGDLRDELTCSVCLELCVRPCTTPCGHSFCRSCLRQALAHCRRCPKCREDLPHGYELKVNTALWNIAQLLFPRAAAEAPPPTPAAPPRPAAQRGPVTRSQLQGGGVAAPGSPARVLGAGRRPASGARRERRRGGGDDDDARDDSSSGARSSGHGAFSPQPAGTLTGGGGGGAWLAAEAQREREELLRLQLEEEMFGDDLSAQAVDADLEALLRTVFGDGEPRAGPARGALSGPGSGGRGGGGGGAAGERPAAAAAAVAQAEPLPRQVAAPFQRRRQQQHRAPGPASEVEAAAAGDLVGRSNHGSWAQAAASQQQPFTAPAPDQHTQSSGAGAAPPPGVWLSASSSGVSSRRSSEDAAGADAINTIERLLRSMQLLSTPPRGPSGGSAAGRPAGLPSAGSGGAGMAAGTPPGATVAAQQQGVWHIHSGDSPVPVDGLELLMGAREDEWTLID